VISLLHVTEDPRGLLLSYPCWTAAALALACAALAAYGLVRRRHLARRWPVTLAVLFAAWAAIYVATFKTMLTDESGSAYAFLRYDHTVRWKDAADIYLERGNNGEWQIIVIDRQRRVYNFDVAELTVDQRDRVMAYMVDRMPPSTFSRAPELLKRHSTTGTRTVGLFGDQQI
jgi:hypothetical protein